MSSSNNTGACRHRDGVQKRLGLPCSSPPKFFDILNVPHHVEVVSAHRTPDKLFSFAEGAEENGYQVIIAGAGGAAHLPGMYLPTETLGAGARRPGTKCCPERCR